MPLSDLIAALASATGPSHALNERMATEVFGWKLYPGVPGCIDDNGVIRGLPRYTASLDAITGAIKARWSRPEIITTEDDGYNGGYARAEVSLSPEMGALADLHGAPGRLPLALCLAAARLALAEGGR